MWLVVLSFVRNEASTAVSRSRWRPCVLIPGQAIGTLDTCQAPQSPARARSCSPPPAATAPGSTAPCRPSSARSRSTAPPSTSARRSSTTNTWSSSSPPRGAIFVDQESEVPEGAIVVFSAHGVSPAVHDNAAARNLRTIDATCPLVTKVHVSARRFAAEGYTMVMIGHAGHEEVEGTMGEAPESIVLIETAAEVARSTSPIRTRSPSSPRRRSRSTRPRTRSPPCAPSSRRSSPASPTTSVTRRPTARSR